MKTGITHNAYYDEINDRPDYVKMASHGYSCADFQDLAPTDGPLYQMDEADFEKTLTEERVRANDAGITFSQVHAPWPTDDLTPESRAVKLDYMKRAIRGTAFLDGKYLVVHPVMPFGWGEDKDPAFTMQCNRELFTALCSYADDFGVGICIENMPFRAYGISHTAAMMDFLRELNLPNFFFCLDTGHANFFGESSAEMVRISREYLRVLHVHDNDGRQDQHRPPYMGTIDWEDFRCALKEVGYQGVLSLETAIPKRYPEPLYDHFCRGLAMTADYLAGNTLKI